jgi:hypothetical protein
MSRAWVVLQKFRQATLLIASADAPDGGSIALQAVGEIAHTPAGGNGQDDPGVLHLEPRQAAVMGDELQDGPIGGRDGQRAGSSTTHEDASDKGYPQHNR